MCKNFASPSLEIFRLCVQSVGPMFNAGSMLHREILSSSYKAQRLPPPWKLADVVPIPREKPVEDLSKQLRSISLTPAISQLAEDFVASTHVGPAVLKIIDQDQYVIPSVAGKEIIQL